MNLLRRCARARIASSLSLFSHPSGHYTFYLRPLIRFSPYSTDPVGAPNLQDHSTFSTWSQEANKQPLADSPRPREIPYQAKVANLVNLIGHIKLPVKFQSFSDGKHYAATLISQENGTENGSWFPVLFEGDLAHVVSCHVKENDCVYVTGKLSVDPLPFVVHQNQGDVHILAVDINFVEGFDEKAHVYSWKKKKNAKLVYGNVDSGNVLSGGSEKKSGVAGVTDNSSEEIDNNVKHSLITGSKRSAQNPKQVGLWKDLMQNPNQFVNFTGHKSKGLVSQKHPDFKHRESGDALWLNSAPHWFLESFKNWEDVDTSAKKEGLCKDSKEELWKSLAENPEQWQDNRLDKKTEKSPDFIHKKTGKVLWLDRSPEWFVPKDVTIVKDRKDESWVEDPNQWWDNMSDKKNEESTDFKPKEIGEGLSLDRSPDCVGKDSIEELWKSLAENPEQWWDNRLDKKYEKSPDFKHKKTGKGLWIDKSPEWFVPKDVTMLKDRKKESWVEDPNQCWDNMSDKKNEESTDFKPKETGEGLWLDRSPDCVGKDSSLAENPEQWWDNRLGKKIEKSPDFKHKKTGVGLWIGKSPDWFVPKDVTIVKDKKNESWKSLVENPNQWWDIRLVKKNEKTPDFKHKKTGEGLWIGESPDWFVPKDITIVKDKKNESWKSLVENSNQWWDNRLNKKNEKAPDFKHKETGEGLWIGESPDWFVPKDITIVKDKKITIVKDKKNESWKSLVENPNQWWDNRLDKKNEKAPDFKHKETGEGLWLNSSPDWAVSKLPPLKQNEHVGGV